MPKLHIGEKRIVKKSVTHENNTLEKGSRFEIIHIGFDNYAVKSDNWSSRAHDCGGRDPSGNSWWVPFYMIDAIAVNPIKDVSIYEERNS